MTDARIRLGPFELSEIVGTGGMGEIWRARHEDEATDVAVKVISGVRSRDGAWRERFRTEVQVVASLDHPCIVEIHDHGRVDSAAAAASGDRLIEGAPWVAMEFASGGALVGAAVPTSWAETRDALDALLRGLAHAHARGIVHRDVKPANVLRALPDDGRAGVRLADFGIAHAIARGDESGSGSVGTPLYMAPEQFTEPARAHGPWTDLYALGCVAWEWVTGSTPFMGHRVRQIADQHLLAALPPLRPLYPVPDDLITWLRGLLDKDPRARVGHAADALRGLRSLGAARWQPDLRIEVDESGEMPTLASADEFSEIVAHSVTANAATMVHTEPLQRAVASETLVDEVPPVFEPSPLVPVTWRHDGPGSVRRALRSTGRGIYGMRAVPFVGREAELDTLWETLLECERASMPRVVVVRGATGVGRTRLLEQFGTRAAELGAATWIGLEHGETSTAMDGWRGALARFTRSSGLSRSQVRRHLRALVGRRTGVDPDAVADLAEIIVPRDDLDDTAAGRRRELQGTLGRWLRQLAERRPVVITLDDAQWASSSLETARVVLRIASGGGVPVVFVVAVRDDAMADHVDEQAAVDAMAASPDARSIQLQPLAAEDRGELVERMLGLTAEAGAAVIDAAGGNPLYAVQIVEAWHRGGRLVSTSNGYALAAGAAPSLSDDMSERWKQVLLAALDECDDAAVAGIERAAAFGVRVDPGEWSAACPPRGAEASDAAVDALVRRRLVVREPWGAWRFAHAMLREGARRSAEAHARWAGHHEACARALSAATGGLIDPRRVADHLFHARLWDEAERALADATEIAHRAGDFVGVLAVLRQRERALDGLGARPDDPRRGATLARRARALDLLGRHSEALSLVDELDRGIKQHGWTDLQGLAWSRRSISLYGAGAVDDALAWADRATAWFAARGDSADARTLQLERAWMLRQLGRLDEAAAEFERLLDELADEATGHRRMAVLTRYASVAKQRGDLPRARELLEQAVALNRRSGDRLTEATCINGLAEVDRFSGNLDAAAAGYQRAMTLYAAVGTNQVYTSRLNLALTLLERGEFDAVDEHIDAIDAPLRRLGASEYVLCARILRLAAATARGDTEAWQRMWPDVADRLAATGMVDVDIARPLDGVARNLLEQGDLDAAKVVGDVAVRQYRALGRAVEADALLEDVGPLAS